MAFSGTLTSLLLLAQLAITARALGAALFGHLAIVMAVAGLLAQVFDFRTWELAGKHVAKWLREPESSGAYIAALLTLDVVTGVGAGILLIAIAGPTSSLVASGQIPVQHFVGYAFVVTLTMLSGGAASGTLRAMNKFKTLACRSIASALIGVISVALAVSTKAGVLAVIVAMAITEALNVALTLALLARSLPTPLSWSLVDHRTLVRHIKQDLWSCWLGGTVKGFQGNIDTPLVGLLAGPQAAGLYRFATSIGSQLSKLGNPVQAVILPVFANMNSVDEPIAPFARRITLFLGLSVVTLFGLLIAMRSFVVDLAGGSSFTTASDLLSWILPGVAVNVILMSWLRPAIVVRSYWKVQNKILLIFVVLSLVGYVAVVPSFGAIGAAAVTGMTLALSSLASCVGFFMEESRLAKAGTY